ncbi:MAG: alkaline phosphatase family protein, partial [Lysobacterales bacterium]
MEMSRKILIIIAFTLISSVALADRPALILQITVDQLRADMVWRNADRFAEGGYRYLLDEGTVYTDARFRHATTVTAVGHATLATGSSPRQHGIVANDWWDRGNRRV